MSGARQPSSQPVSRTRCRTAVHGSPSRGPPFSPSLAALVRMAALLAQPACDLDELGELIESDVTEKIFTNPADPRTEDYVTGKVG